MLKLRLKLILLNLQITYYDKFVYLQHINISKPWKKLIIPTELLSCNAPDKYQKLWDEYVSIQQEILEL